jgi:hypothetical protein
MEKIGNPKYIGYLMFLLIIVVGAVVISIGFTFSPKIDYTSIPYNQTALGNSYWLAFSSIPTIINGITASTSIIIGFTGAIIGVLYQLLKDDEATKRILLYSAIYELIPLTFLFLVYEFLLLGLIQWATQMALFAFALSLLNIAIAMLGSIYRIAKKENNLPLKSMQQPSQPPMNPETNQGVQDRKPQG